MTGGEVIAKSERTSARCARYFFQVAVSTLPRPPPQRVEVVTGAFERAENKSGIRIDLLVRFGDGLAG
jgi:hypothetical protein